MRNRALGQRVVDYLSLQPHRPYEQAETLEDVTTGLRLVRGFLQLGRYDDAVDTLGGSLARALVYNLNAASEVLTLLILSGQKVSEAHPLAFQKVALFF